MTGRHTDGAADVIARVAIENWPRLLRVHRQRLAREDLEDCLAQATYELLAATIQDGVRFADREAVRIAFELRVDSRIIDRRRAFAGRSPITAATHHACRLDALANAFASSSEDPLSIVLVREQLACLTRAAAESLSSDQRLVLRSQLRCERPAAFCASHDWSLARYHKTAQRARLRLRRLASP